MILNAENKLVNAIGFQAVWWTDALYSQWAIWIGGLLISMHFIFLKNRKKEFYFVLTVSLIGILMDSILSYLKVIDFQDSIAFGLPWVPIWMMILWITFASTLNHCLSWVFKNVHLSFLIGGLGGSLSYIGAAKLGVVNISAPPTQVFFILFILWGILFTLLKIIREAIR